uniref:Uncharacterized protein n=1 Tax=Nelumbo nucifera TaxID=4432 RepID=A0A822XRR4_NELNU|nr:TPA_asm: hypothetical protein HUJ06_023294 [Nelumbo nucifera]
MADPKLQFNLIDWFRLHQSSKQSCGRLAGITWMLHSLPRFNKNITSTIIDILSLSHIKLDNPKTRFTVQHGTSEIKFSS